MSVSDDKIRLPPLTSSIEIMLRSGMMKDEFDKHEWTLRNVCEYLYLSENEFGSQRVICHLTKRQRVSSDSLMKGQNDIFKTLNAWRPESENIKLNLCFTTLAEKLNLTRQIINQRVKGPKLTLEKLIQKFKRNKIRTYAQAVEKYKRQPPILHLIQNRLNEGVKTYFQSLTPPENDTAPALAAAEDPPGVEEIESTKSALTAFSSCDESGKKVSSSTVISDFQLLVVECLEHFGEQKRTNSAYTLIDLKQDYESDDTLNQGNITKFWPLALPILKPYEALWNQLLEGDSENHQVQQVLTEKQSDGLSEGRPKKGHQASSMPVKRGDALSTSLYKDMQIHEYIASSEYQALAKKCENLQKIKKKKNNLKEKSRKDKTLESDLSLFDHLKFIMINENKNMMEAHKTFKETEDYQVRFDGQFKKSSEEKRDLQALENALCLNKKRLKV